MVPSPHGWWANWGLWSGVDLVGAVGVPSHGRPAWEAVGCGKTRWFSTKLEAMRWVERQVTP